MSPLPQSEVVFKRQQERVGKVPTGIRVVQGIGGIPDTLKTIAIRSFLLLYYDQVLGLYAGYVSAVLLIAVVIDGITDPIVGSWSDAYRSALGRRHPFMYFAILPLGVSLFCLFAPPKFNSDGPLLAWLLFFVVSTRISMTFYVIPWSALFAEFTDDYTERSTIVTYRFAMSWIGSIVFTVIAYRWVFAATQEYEFGLLNPDAYPTFALMLALCVMSAAFASTHFTRSQIPFLRQPPDQRIAPKGRVVDLRQVFADVVLALGNREFRLLFIAVLLSAVVIGTNGAFETYMRTYFWGMDSAALAWFALNFMGGYAITTAVR